MKTTLLTILVANSLLVGHASAATGPDLPPEASGSLYQRAKAQPADRAERIKLNAGILDDGRKCLAAHPDVPPEAGGRDILVRRVLLPAAERLFSDAPTPENREQLRGFATEVATSAIYEGHLMDAEKPRAGFTLARLASYPNDDRRPVDAAKHIRAFIDQFPVRPGLKNPEAMHGQALVYAAQLANETGEKALADELCKSIVAKHLGARMAIDTLISLGYPIPFETELTTLDGSKISFPKDTLGKVVVVDFWATWCGPCRASLPHVKEIHEKFKDRGVMVIGVSCDSPQPAEALESNKQKVATMVAKEKLDWTQTYSGEWPAPAVKYGVSSIPKVFIIGRDGNIITTEGRGREEAFILQALGTSDTQP